MARLHVEVTGRVQGVGFRWFVRERARALGLAGWVRNLSTGSVEIAAEGPDAALAELERAVQEGPPNAVVRDVIRRADPGGPLPQPFAIT